MTQDECKKAAEWMLQRDGAWIGWQFGPHGGRSALIVAVENRNWKTGTLPDTIPARSILIQDGVVISDKTGSIQAPGGGMVDQLAKAIAFDAKDKPFPEIGHIGNLDQVIAAKVSWTKSMADNAKSAEKMSAERGNSSGSSTGLLIGGAALLAFLFLRGRK